MSAHCNSAGSTAWSTKPARAARAGFSTFGGPQIFGFDTLTALTVVARDVPELKLVAGVVPTYPRHPTMLAAQARTLQQVSHGRFTLGIAVSLVEAPRCRNRSGRWPSAGSTG